MSCEVCSMEGKEQVGQVTIAAQKKEQGWYLIIESAVPIMGWKSILLGRLTDEHEAKAKVVILAELLRQQSHLSDQK